MSTDPSDGPRDVAVDTLEALGLSAYAARTFVALMTRGQATAREVSETVEVPRPRVYDAVEELQQRGLVDVQHGQPRQFWAVSVETAGQVFAREFQYRVDELTAALETLEDRPSTEEQRGVWTVTGETAIAARVERFIDDAEEEVVLMTVEEAITEDLLAHLRAAAERGVTVRLAHMCGDIERDVHTEVPGAEVFDTEWNWAATPARRLLMVDGTGTLVSVLVAEDGQPEGPTETAIWGSGESNSLVAILRAMFTRDTANR